MALHVCENISEDLFVIINKLFSTKYPIDIIDLTNWSKLILLLPCFQRFSLFSRVYLKSKLWVVKLLKLNIENSWFDYRTQNAVIWQYIMCCPNFCQAQILISILWKTEYSFLQMFLPKVLITIQKVKRLNNKHYKCVADFHNFNDSNIPLNIILQNPTLKS